MAFQVHSRPDHDHGYHRERDDRAENHQRLIRGDECRDQCTYGGDRRAMDADLGEAVDAEKDERVDGVHQTDEHIMAFRGDIRHGEQCDRGDVATQAEHVDTWAVGAVQHIEPFDAPLPGEDGQIHQRSESQRGKADTESRGQAEHIATHQPSARDE